jgi:glyoxylase-like metal-dependent hydrolase (beta-lactamase superfamily II)
MKTAIIVFLSFLSLSCNSEVLKVVDIAKNGYENIKAIVGPITNRDAKNLGNNATFGVIITKKSVILIDSGGSYLGAKALHEKIKSITNNPIKFVINSGGQDHRFFGNNYFKGLGATIISSKNTKDDHINRTDLQMARLESLIGKNAIKNTNPQTADIVFDSEYKLSVDGLDIEIYHKNAAHTPGDSFIWVPKFKTMFAGDIVYVERMLGVGGQSDSKGWVESFEAMASFNPKVVVPGHGSPVSLQKAKKDTYEYLKFLRDEVAVILENDGGMLETGKVNQDKYKYLFNFESLAGRNIQKVFSEMEFE